MFSCGSWLVWIEAGGCLQRAWLIKPPVAIFFAYFFSNAQVLLERGMKA
ncbi:hypothetical protein HNQ36_003900 [Afipia massiliensis]|uniref:Uncharacterized protein n=1 Tax=Afipia massiliensis TaxID=211460 RepID=A0A840N447_9BRAD|nr:hypothetical protein [Afipia massiliensis]